MRLLSNWKRIVRRAWSVRLIAIAGVLTGLESIIPMWVDSIPRPVFSMLLLAVITLAMVARFVAQEGLDKDEK